jgi:flagellar protein FliS
MAYSNNSVHAYRETRVKTVSQGRIIVMLYDEALRQIDEAVGLLDTGTKQLDRVNNSVVKAQDIITELMVSLDMEQGGDIARNLFRLYMFFNDRLMEGNVRKEAKPLVEVRGLMANLRDAWREIENVATPSPAVTTGVNIAG